MCKTLYIVPTPIGNLQDITYRAVSVLNQVDYIIVESVRRTKVLLDFFSIRKPLYVMNRHNEIKQISKLIQKMQEGYSMALVSDAGTPLINDPGYFLVKSCYKEGIKVIPLPGPCAAITALSGSGLPTTRFCFEGFLPSKKSLRINYLKRLSEESRTLIFYDVKYRVIDSLKDMINIFSPERHIVLVRELSKIWECIRGASLKELLLWIQEDKNRIQGELILVVSGFSRNTCNDLSPEILHVLKLLASELSLKKAVILTGDIYKIKKSVLYKKYLSE